MPDDVNEHEFDALAAEYVLGTLDASERAHTHVLLGIDDGFAARVKMWERRLGELHVMVEPVDPDWRVWERIKDKIGGFQSNPFYVALDNKGVEPEQAQDAPPTAPPELWDLDAPLSAPPEPGSIAADVPAEGPAAELPAAAPAAPVSRELPAVESAPPAPAAVSQVPESERTVSIVAASRALALDEPARTSSDETRWRRATGQWRVFALFMMLIALVLAGFLATLRNFPDRIPPSLRQQFQATAAVSPSPGQPARPKALLESQFEE